MSAETFASPQNIRDRWLSTEELPSDEIIQHWITDAETLIFSEFPDLRDRLTNDPHGDLHRSVAYVEVQLVSQALKNPDGIRQLSQTSGPFTTATTYGTETISQLMQITPAHRAILAGKAKKNFGIDMTHHPQPHPLTGAWINGPRS